MKRIVHHPAPRKNGKRFWRSLGEYEDTQEFREWIEREFPAGASELRDGETSRRAFMKLMGASTALAGFGMAGCRRPEKYLVPYTKNVEWIVPGKPLMYATSMPRLGGVMPVVATTHEGRPTTLGGNSLHPSNRFQVDGKEKGNSGTDQFCQASVLDLYDPDRSRDFLKAGKKSSVEAFMADLEVWRQRAQANRGEGVAFLVGESSSPTRDRLLGDLLTKFPQAKLFRYEAFGLDHVRQGVARYFGRSGVKLLPKIDQATRVLSLDADFLGLDLVGGNATFGFSMARRADRYVDGEWKRRSNEEMLRLYSVEPAFTVTGSMADHRLRLAASQVVRVAQAVANALGVAGVSAPELGEREAAWIAPMVEDLKAASGKSLVMAGLQQSADVHALVAAINEKLGAFGKTLSVLNAPERPFGDLNSLRESIIAGEIVSLVSTTAADPVFDAPNDFRWPEIVDKVTYIQLGVNVNHTAVQADWHIPSTHFLEEWGDGRTSDGTYSVIQPMVSPLYGGVSEISLFLKLLQEEPLTAISEGVNDEGPSGEVKDAPTADYYAVRDTFTNTLGVDNVDQAWNHCLRDGFLPNTGYADTSATGSDVTLKDVVLDAPGDFTRLEVRFVPDSKIYDGRYVNNGWLQEAPDPISKLTWDNAALLSVGTFNALGLEKDGQRVRLSFNGREGFFPVLRAPGHADNCVSIAVGYGQRVCGQVGYGTGFDAYAMRTAASSYIAQGAKLEALKEDEVLSPSLPKANHAPHEGEVVIAKWEELALTQEHNSMEGRGLVRDGSLDDYAQDETFAQRVGMDSHIPKNMHLYQPETRHGVKFVELDPQHQWGMTIDLNSCHGCNACMIACQADNNIPIVGKGQVLRGREMSWIRMDRYFTDPTIVSEVNPGVHQHAETKASGVEILNEDAIEVLAQPVSCQQCESAPCETVCPVNATVHSDDGLNAMAYNRCIGTRYCANNCPYKARRFNFFDYNKRNPVTTQKLGSLEFGNLYAGPLGDRHDEGVAQLQKNPNVTVRMRGVMEKCTYCVQRIQGAKIAQKVKARNSDDTKVGANVIKTACQDSCAADAIQFGNLLNEEDTVNQYKKSGRNYDLLKYVNTRPRTSYLAKIKNPNLKMPGGAEVGTTSKHIH